MAQNVQGDKMNKINNNSIRVMRSLTTAILILVGFAAPMLYISENVEGAILVVDDDGGMADYTEIQEAIDAANPGDTISVMPGTYTENVAVFQNFTDRSSAFTSVS